MRSFNAVACSNTRGSFVPKAVGPTSAMPVAMLATTILAVPQAQKLLAACTADPERRPLLAPPAIGLFAGLRTGELAALTAKRAF